MSIPAAFVRNVFVAVAVLAIGAIPGAQTPAEKTAADLARLGPQIGARVPDFRLTDQTGSVRDLKSLLGRNGLMLVFFRSAEW